ncbi:MAG: AI-2E family transporter, partial [Clostridia bacterium]
YALLKPKTANRIIDTARHGHMIFGGFLTGQIISSIIVAVICFFFSIIARMPYPLLLCVIIGVTNIIPFFGPFIGGIPATLLVAVIDPVKGLIFGIFIIILQQIDGNIISAKILGNVTGISEFWVTFALLLFGGMFGFVGMIVGVPLFAALYYILKTLVDDRMQKKKFATKCEFYLDVERYNEETQSFEMIDSEARLEAKILKRQLKEWKLTKFVKSKIFKNSKKK